jgi:phosphate:Na+ symporter
MTVFLFKLMGGIGLFLIGMLLLTDGLKVFAGEALRRSLVLFTGTPLKAFTSGAFVTMLVQSSSATTVAVIGFVSAGLLTFPQAVGVVIGTSLGTTSTGWIVAVLGLKVSIGLYSLPLVGIGTLVRLFSQGRWQGLGLALAGFGLIFVGIDTLSDGMRGMADVFTLTELPSGGLFGNLLMMLIGVAMTMIMQSSSAAVATTLAGMHTGAVNFEQAAALVIGAAIGTTITGALAAIGANVSAKRTALAHVTFNLATGVIAVLALPLLLWGITWAQDYGLDPGAVSLAAFHTTFIGCGVLLFLPFVNRFARWIEQRLPEKGPILTRHLDDTVLTVPEVALEATRRAVIEIACTMFRTLRARLGDQEQTEDRLTDAEIRQALEHTQQFFGRIPHVPGKQPAAQNIEPAEEHRIPPSSEALMHALDHLVQLMEFLRPAYAVRQMMSNERLQSMREEFYHIVRLGEAGLRGTAPAGWLNTVEEKSRHLAERFRLNRPAVLKQTADGEWAPHVALHMLDAMRLLERTGNHVVRICNHLGTVVPREPAITMEAQAAGPAVQPAP